MRITLVACTLLALALPDSGEAGTPVSQRVTCPIGGRSFEYVTTASYSTWGARPDGRPFGSWEFPLALPECPDNGLVMYRAFSEEEAARLRPLVASPEYQALRRSGDTSYYRAYWLMGRMDAPVPETLWMLVQATWQAEGDPALRRRYLEELVARGPELGVPRDLVGIAMRSRVINALRELGRFDEALAMLDATDFDAFPERSAETERELSTWRGHYWTLRRIIARRDPSIEPLDQIPWREARPRCEAGGDRLDETQRAICRERGERFSRPAGD
ncbi:MAG: hypothetical protein QOI38_2546 [Sphingomonadales bacterium]|jgi:hypothetical protein|nr:hypothetical protein [Sphingomonadales bacterium]